ncbi:MAG: hypothetical protein ACK4NY_18800 [Spirosomataceae bacterium]
MQKSEEKSPILKTWNNVYYLVIGALVIQIIIYYWLTKHFA